MSNRKGRKNKKKTPKRESPTGSTRILRHSDSRQSALRWSKDWFEDNREGFEEDQASAALSREALVDRSSVSFESDIPGFENYDQEIGNVGDTARSLLPSHDWMDSGGTVC